MTTQFPQQNNTGSLWQYAAHPQPMPHQANTFPSELQLNVPDTYPSQFIPDIHEQETVSIPATTKKRSFIRIAAIALACILIVCMFFIWRSSATPTPSAENTTLQHLSVATTLTAQPAGLALSPTTSNGKIQVYIVGAVKHPGIYFLESNARVYQVLQMAGGTLPQANLVTLNLAARLSDGQELYVAQIGETPPVVSISSTTPTKNATSTSNTNTSSNTGVSTTGVSTTGSSGALVNINTASSSALRTGLHISSATAQKIINYRTQYGSFTSIDQLLQVVSQAIYKKIKDEVTLA